MFGFGNKNNSNKEKERRLDQLLAIEWCATRFNDWNDNTNGDGRSTGSKKIIARIGTNIGTCQSYFLIVIR